MKKIKSFIRLLSLTLFGLIEFSIISCENTTDIPSIESSSPTSEPIHTHEWDEGKVTKEATCIEEGQITYSCTNCDEVKFETISALGHNEVIDEAKEATCTETGLTEGKHCDRCNEVLVQQEEISSLGHSFADWTIVKEATCENTGIKRRDCNNCDHYEEETIEAKEHNYESIVTNPTCIEQGYETFTCTNCNHSYIDNYVDALGHNTGELVAEIPATCTSKGTVAHYYCDVCNSYLDTNKNKIDSIDIPMKEHEYDSSIYHFNATGHWNECNNCKERSNFTTHTPNIDEPTETNDVICTICDYVIEHALGHTHNMQYSEKIEPTCEENGYIAHYQCNGCKKYYEDEKGLKEIKDIRELVISSFGHNYGELVLEVSATCTTDGKVSHYHCDRCDKYFNTEKEEINDLVIKALGHNEAITESKEATCTTTGLTEGKHCDRCGEILEEQKIVAALGHNEVIDTKVDATCEETGLAQGSHCDRCNEVLVAQKVIPAKGHTEVTDKAVNATCTETGLTQGSHCSTCNKVLVEQDVIPALGHNEVIDAGKEATCTTSGLTEGSHCDRCKEILVAQEVTPALGHNEVVDTKVDATCEDTGLTEGKHCDRCNEVLVAQKVIPAKGHTEVTDKAINATCTTSGLTEGSHCSTCNKVLVEQEIVPALGHNEVVDKAKEATCTTTGLTEGKHCDRCEKTLIYQQTIPVIPHTEVIDKAVAPTCTSNGLTEGKHCEVCEQILVYQQTILATGHNEVIIKAISPTCAETGLTEGKYCSKCNETLVEQRVVEALGHDYDLVVTEPTCEEQGYTTHTCSRCDDSYVDSYVNEKGHSYGDWSETVAPGCESVGTKRRDCEECDHYEEEEIAALGHVEVIDKALAPSCESTGLTEGSHCDRCKEVLVAQEEVAALGHDYDSVVTNPTCEEQGYTTHTCSRCDDSYVDSYTKAIGHDFDIAYYWEEPNSTNGFVSIVFTCKNNPEHVAYDADCNSEVTSEVIIEATCEEQGLIRYTVSGFYYKPFSATYDKATPALGHNEVIDEGKEPTCTETGLTEGSHCSVCNKVFVEQEEVAIKEHNYVDYVCSECGDDNYYTKGLAFQLETNGEYTVFYFNGTDTDIIIPKKYKGLPVTKIGVYLFDGWDTITSVSIPDSIKYIEQNAFKGCTSLTNIIIPDSVISIGVSAFYGCNSLASVTMGNNLTNIGGWAFYGCSSLTNVTIGNSLTSIGNYAFDSCSSLTSITIPDSVTCIDIGTFKDCSSLKNIEIPNSITYIGDQAFTGCSSLASVAIPDSVTTIGWGAFYGCSSLKNIEIPNSVSYIGDHLFIDCSSLTSITLPNILTSIGFCAFYGCSSLENIEIPNSVSYIGDQAFTGCSSLTNVAIPDGVTSIGNHVFNSCNSLTSIIIPDSVTSVGEFAFASCSSLTSIKIPNNVTSIGVGAFYGCSSLENIEIPNSVSYIGDHLFVDCSSLTSITLPNSLTSIGNGAFAECSSLENIEMPNSVTSIGNSAFEGCSSLTSITIPDGVTSIGDWAFEGCSSLTSITIPDNVISIGNYAFYRCSSLTDVYYTGTEEQWNAITIGNYNDYIINATIHYTEEIKVDAVSVLEAINASEGEEVYVKGVVAASAVDQTAFYIADETGIIAIRLSNASDFAQFELGDEIVVKGIRTNYPKADYTKVGQVCLDQAEFLVNYQGNHEYSTSTFQNIEFTDLTALLSTNNAIEATAQGYIVGAKITKVEAQFYSNIYLADPVTGEEVLIYCSTPSQYSFLNEFIGQTVTVEVVLVDWNSKGYKACVLSVVTEDGKVINNYNFN